MKKYKLSGERLIEKDALQEKISELEKKKEALEDEIDNIKESGEDVKLKKANKRLQIEEINRDIMIHENNYNNLYIKEVKEKITNILEQKKEIEKTQPKKENDTQQKIGSHFDDKDRENLSIANTLAKINQYVCEIEWDKCDENKIALQIYIENLKYNLKMEKLEEKDRSIKILQKEREDISENSHEVYGEIIKLMRKIEKGKNHTVTNEELDKIINRKTHKINKSFEEELENLLDLYLEEDREIETHREKTQTYDETKEIMHDRIYKGTRNRDARNAFFDKNTIKDFFTKERSELATEFCLLESETEFLSEKLCEMHLLEMEKVRGLQIDNEEGSQIINQDVYIATYEINNGDYKYYNAYEYYIKENDRLKRIGYSRSLENKEYEEKPTLLHGNDTIFEINEQDIYGELKITKGISLDKVNEKIVHEEIVKNMISKSFDNRKITGITEIESQDLIKKIINQMGSDVSPAYGLYIVSSLDEDGKEIYDIGFVNYFNNAMPFQKFDGIKKRKTDIDIIKNLDNKSNGLHSLEGTESKNLQEFETKDGHRYAITKNQQGELEFKEIYIEKEDYKIAEDILSHAFTTDNLKKEYQDANINQSDIEKALKSIQNKVKNTEMDKEERNN